MYKQKDVSLHDVLSSVVTRNKLLSVLCFGNCGTECASSLASWLASLLK